MVKYARRSVIPGFFTIFWLLIAITPVFGRGRQDTDLIRADELINAREYDEATALLSDYIRRNPDNFEQAQRRLHRINQNREEFNQIAEQLIFMLLNDSDNSERILDMTLRLRALESDNSPLIINFVARIQEIAQFNVYRNQLRRIMENGRDLLDKGDSLAAVQNYAGGMGIMREEFFTAWDGNRIGREVLLETERINSAIASFEQTNNQMETMSAELVRAISSGQSARAAELINRLMPVIDSFIELKQIIFSSAAAIDRILDGLREADPDIGERSHLAFVSRLIHGRQDETVQEGILGAFDTSWNKSIGSVIEIIISNAESLFQNSLLSFSSGDFEFVVRYLSGNESYMHLSPLFFEKHRQFPAMQNPQTVLINGNQVLREDMPSYLKIIALNEACDILLRATYIPVYQGTNRSSAANGRLDIAEALNREQQTRDALYGMQRDIIELISNAIQIDTETEMSSRYNITYIRDAIAAIENLHSDLFAEVRLAAQRYYTIEQQYLELHLAIRRDELQKGRNLLEGQSITDEEGIVTVHRFPAEASEQLTAMLSAVSVNLEHGNGVLRKFSAEPQMITANAEFANLQSNYQALVRELDSIRSQGTALSETARSRSALADSRRQQGERFFREAQTAYQRQDFETARLSIQRATEQFTGSLEIQESSSLRETWDTQLINLGRAITVAENERIIAEVRNLINEARSSYFARNFQQAENILVRAKERWLITNSEENEEVLYWLGMVQSGISARSSTVVPSTAPLYPIMSQLLSQAQINFEEGVRLINAGQRDQGLAKFNEARSQTTEVKLVFPVNQEAGILELRMEQFLDPSAFNASFEQRIRSAINGTRQRSLEAYADLQNLAEINPRYPGISAILDQAEIDMGFRPPPPNSADIARSRELTASASRIADGNLTAQFEVALAQINEAVALNPENEEAVRVKDRLLRRMSVPGTIVLSSEDKDQYQRAVRELQAGNNLLALAITDRLMQNPSNRNVTKLVELQRRIQSVL